MISNPDSFFAKTLSKGGGEVNKCKKRMNGAEEGIRTLDPNLGKVVLYP